MGMTLAKVITILILCEPCFGISLTNFEKMYLPAGATGPDSLAFNVFQGPLPWTGCADGRILKYKGSPIGFVDFAHDSLSRSILCNGNTAFGKACGRPLGLGYRYRSTQLYICDAFLGLLAVSTNGGLARQLVSSAEGQKLMLADGLAIDRTTGNVLFTDASGVFNINELPLALLANDSTGRFIKYDPITNATTVLLKNLSAPAGIAVSSDGSYALITEYIAKRVIKYWLKGPKTNTSQVLVTFAGRPDNIKKTPIGDSFWVAVSGPLTPSAVLIDSSGQVLANISLAKEYGFSTISEAHEYDGHLYIGSLENTVNYVGKYQISLI